MLLYGSRISFSVAIITSVSTIGIGMLLGIAAGFYRGRVDAVIGRFSDLLFAFPSFFMIIALSIPMVERVESLGIVRDNGARLTVLIIFFVFFGWPGFARLVRSQAMSLRERDFIMAAQSQGASNWRIITKEMLPNLWPTAIVFLSLSLPGYLAAEAVFSFLGVGINPPATTFGLVLSDGIKYWRSDPAYLIIPSAMLVVIVLALNLFGDAVRDALDTKAE
jgi:peptide/nickel transport system permease protein